MKAAAFAYVRPASIEEAIKQLASMPGEAKPIAGGQSLGPMLNLRLARPKLLVDVSRLEAMRTIEDSPSLPPALLNAHFPDVRPFRSDETVELIHDPLNLQDLNNIWEILGKQNIQLSATYVARVIPIDSTIESGVDTGRAQTRVFDVGTKDLT